MGLLDKKLLMREVEEALKETPGPKPRLPHTLDSFRKQAFLHGIAAMGRIWKLANNRELLKKNPRLAFLINQYAVQVGIEKPSLVLELGGEQPIRFIFAIAKRPVEGIPEKVNELEDIGDDSADEGCGAFPIAESGNSAP